MFRKIIVIATALLLAAGAAAAMDHSGHSMKAPEGKKIRTVTLNGHRLEYRLIDMKEKARQKGLKIAPGMKSHHLMLYVVDEKSGKMVADGRAGYLVTAPDGRVQKVMAMKMNMGYGGDIDLASGENRVKVKFVAGGTRIVDEFTISNQ